MPSGGAFLGVLPLCFAARISRDAYEVFVASSTKPSSSAQSSQDKMSLARDEGRAVSHMGFEPLLHFEHMRLYTLKCRWQ